MARLRFEYCPICKIRARVDELLELPSSYVDRRHEPPSNFWTRMEQAGKLCEAVELYKELEIERKTRAHTQRETIGEFQQRIKKERRLKEAERLRIELLEQGLSLREVQEKLVEKLQPVSGDRTRAWQTPNPWNEGRLCRRKADQVKLLALKGKPPTDLDVAKWRLQWAEHRLAERRALVAARRRAQALKAASQKLNTAIKASSSPSSATVAESCNCYGRGGHYRSCCHFVEGRSSIPCDHCPNGFVGPSNPTYYWQRGNLCDACYGKGRNLG